MLSEPVVKHTAQLVALQCGSYHIGKERAYLGAAKLLGWKVWCDANKRRVSCQNAHPAAVSTSFIVSTACTNCEL